MVNSIGNDLNIKTDEESLNPVYQPGNTLTPIPVDVEMDKELHSVFQDPIPEVLPEPNKEVPGFFETVGGKFAEQSPELNIADYLNRTAENTSPLDDYVDPNWTARSDKSALIGINPLDAPYVLAAEGPNDLVRRRNYVMDRREHEDRLNRGSVIAQGLGGFAGATVSLSSWVPIAQALKYGKLSQTFLQTLPKMVPGVAISSAANRAAIETDKVDGNLHDWAIDTLVDTAFGTAFMGAHLGGSHLIEAGKLFNARGVFKMINKGIEPVTVVDEKGIITGHKAVAMDSSVGAKEVDFAQKYLDSALSQNFLHGIPYIGDQVGSAVGKSASWFMGKVHPITRMKTSRFTTLRTLIDHVAEHAYETKGVEEGRELETPFETFMGILRGTNSTFYKQYTGLFQNYNGIFHDPSIPLNKQKANATEMYRKAFDKGMKTEEDFFDAVQKVVRKEIPSDNEAVNTAAKLIRENKDPLYLEWLQITGVSDKILKKSDVQGYLSLNHWIQKMETNEELYVGQVADELGRYDKEIIDIHAPLKNADEEIRLATETHEKLIRRKKKPTDEQVKESSNNLEELKKQRTMISDNIQNQIRADSKLHVLADDIHAVSAKEARQINTILKPSKKISKDIEVQKDNVKKAKEELARNKQASLKAKTAETGKKRAKLKDLGETDVRIEEDKLKELQDKYDLEILNIEERIHNKEIPQELLIKRPDSNRFVLKDPEHRLKLRDPYESEFHRRTAAKSFYDSILNQSPEDNINNMFNRINGYEKTNPLVARTIPLREDFFYDNKWVNPNMATNVMNYRLAIGRKIATKKILDRITVNGTFDELALRMNKEYELEKSTLNAAKSSLQKKVAKQKLYRGYGGPGEKPKSPYPSETIIGNDNLFGKGYWFSPSKELTKRYGRFVHEIEGNFKLYDVEVEDKSILNSLWKTIKKTNDRMDKGEKLHDQLQLEISLFKDELKKEGYQGLIRNGGYYTHDPKEHREVMFFEKPDLTEVLSNAEKKKIEKDMAKVDKKISKLNKEYKSAQKDLSLTVNKMKGISNYTKESREFSHAANLWAYASKLGFLPFTMTTDMMAIVFKNGLWPTIQGGLLPMLKNLAFLSSQKEGEAIRESAAHAHLADNHLSMAYAQKNWAGVTQSYEAVQGKLKSGLETVANLSGNISGANQVQNFNERWSAQVIQSTIIKYMHKYKEGKLKPKELKDLLRYGINPEKHADTFLKEWELAGKDGNGFGGYQSNYWKWENKEAANLMSQAIYRGTKDSIIRRGMFDAPFAMDNPLINSILLFKGYTFASITRYLAPLMQKPDRDKLLGSMLMLAAGATQNPLRRIVKGQDPVEKDDHMVRNAIRDSGVLSSLSAPLEEMDYLFHGLWEQKGTSERYRNMTEMGLMGGPIAGGINDLTRIGGMMFSGQVNKQDLKRIPYNTPLLSTWQLRGLIEKWIEGSGLPKSRTSASAAPH